MAEVHEDRGPAEIHRVQQQRAAVLSANLEDRGLGAAVADIEALLAANPPPPGVIAELGGQVIEMQTSFDSLRLPWRWRSSWSIWSWPLLLSP